MIAALPRRLLAARAVGSLRRDDFHETPRIATEALLRVETFTGPIWEPARGRGAISSVLEEHGYTVISADLVDRGYGTGCIDFTLEHRSLAPNIVTNPPYRLADEFARRAYSLTTGKVALLTRLAWRGKTTPRSVQHAASRPCLGVQPTAADDKSGRLRRPESNKRRRSCMVRLRSRPRGALTIGWLT